ncbi:MAG: VCBS repeat-containing protein [Candidatus Sabulitectum sp.]|nr:VCBS repeat-containing protein [Candidatus Sabulitectum sp.]
MSTARSTGIGAFSFIVMTLLLLSSVSAANPLFDEPSYVFALDVPILCETADFNCDGNEDFLVTSCAPSMLNIFLGAGDGTFSLVQQTIPFDIGTISVCQLNSDAYPDLVVGKGTYRDMVYIYLGDGAGGFQQTSVLTDDYDSVNTGDLDGDGYSDLLLPHNLWIKVHLCDGEGSFITGSSYEVDYWGIAHLVFVPGDLNGDGFADVAFITVGGYRLGIMLGNGNGTLQQVYYNASSYENCADWATIEEGDYNEDGYLDLVATSGIGWAEDLVLINDGSGVFSTSDSLANTLAWAVAEDFDLDGHLDLAGSFTSIKIYKGWGDGTFGGGIYSNYPSHGQLGVADFDNDGDPDLVRLNYNFSPFDEDSVYVYLNNTIQLGIGEQEEAAPLPILSSNPFRSSLSISVQEMSDASITSIRVFDLSGREVTLIPVDEQGSATWNGDDSAGIEVPPGVYMLKPSGECDEVTSVVLKL